MTVFNVTRSLELLIEEIVRQTEEFAHIDPGRLLVCVASTRGGGVHGTYARIHPLRFPGGERTREVRRGRRSYQCEIPPVTCSGRDILYLVCFLVPRFLDLSPREKLVTVFHELYHISPAFDGDIRRFPGRNYAHGSSRRKYNELVGVLVDRYLEREGEAQSPLLTKSMAELRTLHGSMVGRKYPAPRVKVRELA